MVSTIQGFHCRCTQEGKAFEPPHKHMDGQEHDSAPDKRCMMLASLLVVMHTLHIGILLQADNNNDVCVVCGPFIWHTVCNKNKEL